MKKSAFISDLTFAFFTVFVFFVCILRYYRLPLPLAVAIGLVAGVLTALVLWRVWSKKRKTFLLKKSEEAEKEKLLLHLAFLSDGAQAEFFGRSVLKEGGVLRADGLIEKEDELILPKFRFDKLCADDGAALLRADDEKKKTLFTGGLSEEAERLFKKLGVRICAGEETYLFLKEREALPSRYLGVSENVTKKKGRFSLWFSKSNSRAFFTGGCLLLLTSLITPFPYYYLAFGCILLTVAVLVRIFGRR